MIVLARDRNRAIGLRNILPAVASTALLASTTLAQEGLTCSLIQQQMDQLRTEFARNLTERPLSTGCAILLADTAVNVIMEDTGSRIPPDLRTLGTAACIVYCVGSERAECGTAATTIASIATRYAVLKSTQQKQCRS